MTKTTKIMFTTELLHRICLTVSLSLFIQLAFIGDTHPYGAASALTTTARNELNTKLTKLNSSNGSTIASTKSNQELKPGSKQPQNDRLTAGESEKNAEGDSKPISPSSRSLLFGQPIYNFPHQRPQSTSSSYKDNNERRMSLARVGSTSAYLNARPLSFTTTLGSGQVNRKMVIKNKEYPVEALFSSRKGEAVSSPSFSGPIYECIFSTSKNCGNEQKSPGKSFHGTIFNKRLSTMSSGSQIDRNDDVDDKGSTMDGFSTIPFTIAGKPLKKVSPSLAMSFDHYSTPAPAWIKLEPYDPFAVANKRASLHKNSASPTVSPTSDSSSQFANRIGQEELSPESFAKRYGYNTHDQASSASNKYGGARLPSWLEELNYQQGTSPILDEIREETNRRWVKLDPVSVAGVSISKWVPKGTSPSQLPSTSLWPIRGSSGSVSGSSKPSSSSDWWDRIDTEPSSPPKRHQFQPRPDSFGWSAETGLNSGWGIRYPQKQQPPQQHSNKRRPGISDAWNDIIYPDTPTSATASWEADKDTRFPSSSSISQSSSSSWPTHQNRRPVASWSAPGSSFSGVRVQANDNYPHNTNRRYGTGGSSSYYRPGAGGSSYGRPHSYPDPANLRDDPRWVLVSSTSNIEGADGNRKHYGVNRGPTNANERYASGDSDFPYEFYNNGNRHSKMLLKEGDLETADSIASYTFTPLTQDELFRKTNATLHSLKPALNHHKAMPSAQSSDKSSNITPNRQGILHGDLSDSDNMNLQPSNDVNDEDLLSSSLEFEDIGDGRGSSLSSPVGGTEATANLIVLPQVKDEKSNQKSTAIKPNTAPKRSFLEGLNPIYTAVGAGMVPATLAAILPMALGRRRRKRSDSAQFALADPVLLSMSMNERAQFPNFLPSYLTLEKQTRSRHI